MENGWADWYDDTGRPCADFIRNPSHRSPSHDPDDWCTWDDPPLMPGERPLGIVHDSPEYISLLPKEEYYRQRDAFEAAFNPPPEEPPAPAAPKPSWWRRLLGAD